MRVAYDHHIFSQQSYGGISRYFTSIAPLISKLGVNTRIIAPLHQNAYLPELPPGLVFGKQMPKFKGSGQLYLTVNRPLVHMAMSSFSPHIVHETYYNAHRTAPNRSAIVLTVYDMIHELFSKQLGDESTRAIKAAAIARADLLLCISESTRRDLIQFFPEVEARTRVTYLGFSSSFAAPQVPFHDPQRPFLLYVGPRGSYKNFSALFDAYRGSTKLRGDFDLICIGGGKFDRSEYETISHCGLLDNVKQYDANDLELSSWYASASIFIYPSIYEGFGIPPLEAMAAGCPVIAVRASSVPEVCGTAAELSPDGSPEALRTVIEAVAYDEARKENLRRAGFEQLRLFSWKTAAQKTHACYKELA